MGITNTERGVRWSSPQRTMVVYALAHPFRCFELGEICGMQFALLIVTIDKWLGSGWSTCDPTLKLLDGSNGCVETLPPKELRFRSLLIAVVEHNHKRLNLP